ncbi:hypothetical protein A0H76_3027 [Hepatospora eriocheir]|uniref:Uncharacterized protein n=1 Tax=Hepatospora eriocheir TaxID=1081669 RepID=A0A1X0QC09_9MICR|nr:hypothetical protein HERIO_2758 [Hepatospora eriocheir]ORD99395.1 hypothetical protein A0H76_3027 [Hepatospora eriocheir]
MNSVLLHALVTIICDFCISLLITVNLCEPPYCCTYIKNLMCIE